MRFPIIAAAAVGLMALSAPAQATPTLNLAFIAGTSAQAQAAFTTAANYWSSAFTDTVTVNLTVGTGALSSGVLASASSNNQNYAYSAVRAAMAADVSSAIDTAALAHLPNAASVSMYLNYTSNNPNGLGSATPYVDNDGDANNTTIRMTQANAKALGLATTPSTLLNCIGNCDAFIQFSTGFSYDFDSSNGVSSGTYDFVGLAIHEIGHALGFTSGVDILDINSTSPNFFPDALFTFVTPLDLFRCSTASAANGTTLDLTAGAGIKNFSLDNCATTLGRFAEGITHGDGRQASHWKDNLGLGIMDPTIATGETLIVTPLDLIGFDTIGWNLTVVPEPGTLALGAAWLLGLVAIRRRAKTRAA